MFKFLCKTLSITTVLRTPLMRWRRSGGTTVWPNSTADWRQYLSGMVPPAFYFSPQEKSCQFRNRRLRAILPSARASGRSSRPRSTRSTLFERTWWSPSAARLSPSSRYPRLSLLNEASRACSKVCTILLSLKDIGDLKCIHFLKAFWAPGHCAKKTHRFWRTILSDFYHGFSNWT